MIEINEFTTVEEILNMAHENDIKNHLKIKKKELKIPKDIKISKSGENKFSDFTKTIIDPDLIKSEE